MSAQFASSNSNHKAKSPRRKKGILRITLRVAAGAGLLVAIAAVAAVGVSEARARRHYDVPTHPISVRTDDASIARGARLTQVRFCAECHGPGLAGRIIVESPELGRLVAPSLAPGGNGHVLSDNDWERAVRHGVRADSTSLRIMPAHEFTGITDEDVADIVAYARSLPPATKQMPPIEMKPLIKALDVAGVVDIYPAALIDHTKPHLKHLDAEPTATYGRYLASTCTGCHGEGLSGGKTPGAPPDFPPAANLTPTGIGHYTLADFTRLMRTGVRPDGSHVNDGMPWKFTRSLDDTEIAAIFAYLKTVPPREYGHR